MSVAIWTSFQQIADSTGTPYSGAKVNVYAAGTTTPLTLYSNEGLSSTVSNPVVCDSSGQHAMVYIATASYKTTVTDSSNVTLTNWSKDHIDPGVSVGAGALAVVNGGTGATTAGAARTNLGAASDTAVTSLSTDLSTVEGYHTGTSAHKTASGTTAQRPGSPADYDLRGNTDLATPEMYLGGTWYPISLAPPVAAGFKNLVVSGTGDATITISADAITLENSLGVATRRTSVSLTITASGTGANGIDAGSLATSTWYYVYVIFNPTTGTTAGLLSASATSPTLPSGYTFKALIGADVTDGSSHLHRFIQYGRRFQYVVSASTTTKLPLITSGIQGSTYSSTSPTLVAISVSSVVPSIASRIFIAPANDYAAGTQGSILVAPSTTYGGANNGPRGSGGQFYPCANVAESAGISVNYAFEMMLEGTTIGYAGEATGSAIACLGFELNI